LSGIAAAQQLHQTSLQIGGAQYRIVTQARPAGQDAFHGNRLPAATMSLPLLIVAAGSGST
jgi:hypothetical protein